jgi:glycosyltransferase involved in cell wall biosynthesis
MRLLIAGTARDIASSWESTSKSLQHIFNAVDDYTCLIVESNSNDTTLQKLREWSNEKQHVLSLGHLNEPSRTKRIAAARNAYMNWFKNHGYFDTYDYMLVVDLDSSLRIESDFQKQLHSCMIRDDWDGIGSNRRGRYYDIWALRSAALGCTFDCWEMVSKPVKLGILTVKPPYHEQVKKFVYAFQNVIPPTQGWIPCESAFGCMALYKVKSVMNRVYNGDTTCEHISFHSGLRMFINPAFISGGECSEHC